MGVLALQGCSDLTPWKKSDHLLTRGWAESAPPPPAMAPAGLTPTAETLYCYKSLAQVDCYKTPQAGKEHLRVGQEISPPPEPEDSYARTPPATPEPESIHPSSEPIDVHSLPLSLQKECPHAPTPTS